MRVVSFHDRLFCYCRCQKMWVILFFSMLLIMPIKKGQSKADCPLFSVNRHGLLEARLLVVIDGDGIRCSSTTITSRVRVVRLIDAYVQGGTDLESFGSAG